MEKEITSKDPVLPMSMGDYQNLAFIGLTIRHQFAMNADPITEEYSRAFAEECVGRKHPDHPIDNLKFWAEFKAIMKVIEADALITELNKPKE